MGKITLDAEVRGLSCAGCAAHLKSALLSLHGVEGVEVSVMDKRVVITLDRALVTDQQLIQTVKEAGYELILTSKPEPSVKDESEGALRALLCRLVTTIVLTIIVMGLSMFHTSLGVGASLSVIIVALLSAVIYIYGIGGYHYRAVRGLLRGLLTMDTLISMSTSVAFFYSLVLLFYSSDHTAHYYFDVVGMISSFVLLGHYLEERAKWHTTSALRSLVALQHSMTKVYRDGDETPIPVESIRVGDRIILRKGDRLPVDGSIESDGLYDLSGVYGEPLPQSLKAGTEVPSGAILLSDSVIMTVLRNGTDSLTGRMIAAIRQALASRAPIQRVADRFSSYFVPLIFFLSLLTLLLWGFLGGIGSWQQGLFFAITVLVVACPCALGLATPAAISVALGRASRMGLMIRESAAIEYMSKVTDIVFDKTGTLTNGTPRVSTRLWLGERSIYRALLAYVEQHSSHPLAMALIEDLKNEDTSTLSVDHLHEEIGSGLSFEYEGISYVVGERSFAYRDPKDRSHLSMVQAFEDEHQDATLVYYSRNNHLLAIFVIEDSIRDGAVDQLSHLRHYSGVRLHLLSGDGAARVSAVAEQLGIESALAELSPLDKRDYIAKLKAKGAVVAMIGDGLNDSPALALADVSLAMGTGTGIVNSVAMITIVHNDLSQLEWLIRLSRATLRTIRINYFWAVIYNLLLIPLAAGIAYPHLYISPMWSAGFMAISSLCVVLNSLRLAKKKI